MKKSTSPPEEQKKTLNVQKRALCKIRTSLHDLINKITPPPTIGKKNPSLLRRGKKWSPPSNFLPHPGRVNYRTSFIYGLAKTDEKHLGNLFQGGYGSIIFILFCHTINTSWLLIEWAEFSVACWNFIRQYSVGTCVRRYTVIKIEIHSCPGFPGRVCSLLPEANLDLARPMLYSSVANWAAKYINYICTVR